MRSKVPFSKYSEIIMGQSPKGDTCSNDMIGLPLLNGPTEFGSKYPIPTQFTSDPKKKSNIDDILFCVRGSTTGRMNYADQEYAIGRGIAAIRGKDGYPTAFVRGLIERNLQQLLNIATGSTFPNVGRDMINSFEVEDVLKEDAIKIAHILSTLDDKIELNRKMNQTLEAMAQTLFKSWFVDFDPVHVKLTCKSDEELEHAAKELGISKEILDLFPSEFEKSEFGMIPKGWEVKSLDKIAHYQNGLALQKFRPKNENIFLPVVKISQLNKGYADGEEKADIDINPACIIDSGDIIFSWSGTLLVDIWCGGKGALNQHLFKVTSSNYSKWFYYYWTKQHLFNFQHIAASKAVTMGHIKRSHLTEALCLIPCQNIFNIMEDIISPIVDKIIDNSLEINTLQKTRDTLLPKLLSGEIDVSELEI